VRDLVPELHTLLGRIEGLNTPNLIRILLNAPIAAEEPHPRHRSDALLQPGIRILKGLVHEGMGLDIAIEIIRDEVIIALVDDGVAEGGEPAGVAELAALDGVEDFDEVGVELDVAVGVGVTEVFDVFGEVAEEEDVGFADFAGDFDLWDVLVGHDESRQLTYVGTVTGSNDQTSVEDEFHVTRTAGFGTGGGDMLADIGSRRENLGLTDIVVFNVYNFQ